MSVDNKKSVEMTAKYASVQHKDEPVDGATPVTKPNAVPIPRDKDGNQVAFEDAASVFQYWTMSFMNPLFRKGYSEEGLNLEDLGPVAIQDKTNRLYEKFWAEWLIESKKPPNKRSLWFVLWRTAGYQKLFYALFLYVLFAGLGFVPVMILNKMLLYFEGADGVTTAEIWILTALMFIVPAISSLLNVQSNTILAHFGIDFRNALTSAIFRKSMVLSPTSRQAFSTGMIINMFSADTRQIQAFLFFMNNVLLAPFQIAVSIWLIYRQVQVAVFVGLGFMLVMLPLNSMFFFFLTKYRKIKVQISDKRVKLMNEVLTGIRIIKYYAWELAFEGKITSIRDEELYYLKLAAYLVAGGFTLILMAVPLVQPILVFFTYVKLGNELTAATAFTTISLFNVMQLPFAFLPMGLQQFAQSQISCQRMCSFFAAEELSDYVEREAAAASTDDSAQPVVISATNASFFWISEADELKAKEAAAKAAVEKQIADSKKKANNANVSSNPSLAIEQNKQASSTIAGVEGANSVETAAAPVPEATVNRSVHTLMDMNFSIKRGQLVAVVGAVGSGKSSFLSAIMGDINKRQGGHVKLSGTVAYCAQQPWIFNDTVRENVLFGRAYEEKLFDRAVHSSSLEDDIRILPGGVLTEIGERGINLSGGQKARVALARAVYRQADIYLLDDPLSAVDAHVGEHLFSECIKKELAGKTRILVTHHVHLLPKCDHIIILKDGRIQAQGSFGELQNSGIDISHFVAQMNAEKESADETEANRDRANSSSSSKSGGKRSRSGTATDNKKEPANNTEKVAAGGSPAEAKPVVTKETKAEIRHKDTRKSTLMTLEERKLGDVSFDAYTYYLRSGGLYWFLAGLFMQTISQVFSILSFFWLGAWGAESVEARMSGVEMTTDRSLYYLNYFSMLSMLGLFCVFTRALLIAQHRVKTSSVLHADLLRVVMSAPIRFFDTTPLGRILNRFSSDMQVVDEDLSQSIGQITNSLFSVLGALIGVCASTKGTFLVIMIPLLYIYRDVQRYFRKTNTTVARLASVSMSPVFAEFSQAIGTGTSSIRAYGEANRFTLSLEKKVDKNTVALVMQQLAGQWLAIRLDVIGAIISCFIAIISVASRDVNFIPAGWLGLGMTYSFQITTFMKFCVRVMATCEAQMNSVERIMFYCEHMESEESVTDIDLDRQSSVATAANNSSMALTTGAAVDTETAVVPLVKVDTTSANEWRIFSAAHVQHLEEKAGKVKNENRSFEEMRTAKYAAFHLYSKVLVSEEKKYEHWPTAGKIEYRNVSMAYATGPLVLKDVSKYSILIISQIYRCD